MFYAGCSSYDDDEEYVSGEKLQETVRSVTG